jgi:aminoglycoside phosphotransferase (APT) family kinase protein
MVRSHLTLAALATSAVTGLDVAGATSFHAGGAGAYDAAVLTGRDGHHWIIRVPRTPVAEAEQAADLVALRALSAGVRTRLPFAVSAFAGQAPIDGTRAVVYDFLYGTKVGLESYSTGPDSLSASVGTAIAAIHALPTSFVADAGLPVLTAGECLRACVTIMDRASATGLVPAALIARWERGAEDAKLWQFQPTVINGAMNSDSVLSADETVTGILGWHELRVGDPARDLQWLLANGDAAETAFAAYSQANGAADRQVRQRAMFYAELELAKWLLHGMQSKSTEIVDDAVEMLTGLVDNIRNDVMNPIAAQTMPTMAVDEVEAMLARTERAG